MVIMSAVGDKCCIQHTMGFADMIEPLVEWCLSLVANATSVEQ